MVRASRAAFKLALDGHFPQVSTASKSYRRRSSFCLEKTHSLHRKYISFFVSFPPGTREERRKQNMQTHDEEGWANGTGTNSVEG
jgi:hypothetical protein